MGTGYFFVERLMRRMLEALRAKNSQRTTGRLRLPIINRGNGRGTVFHKPEDYEAFLSLLAEAKKRQRVKLFAFCLMPNHFHLVVEPADQTALSQFMQWLLTSH